MLDKYHKNNIAKGSIKIYMKRNEIIKMAKRRSIVSALLSILLVLSSAQSISIAAEVPKSPYYPYSNEDWWQYQFDGYQNDPNHGPYDNANCGPASSAMVINYLKGKGVTTTYHALISSAYPDVHCFARWNYCKGNGHPDGFYNTDWKVSGQPGATTAQIQSALSSEGIQTHTFTGYDCCNDGRGITNLQNAIDEGKVCICLVAPMYYRNDVDTYFSHWTTVYGYDDNYIYLNDPGYHTGQGFKATKSNFADALWKVTELSTVIISDTKIENNMGSLTVTNPQVSYTWNYASRVKVEWDYSGYSGNIAVDIYKGSVNQIRIVSSVPVTQREVYFDLPTSLVPGTDYKVGISATPSGDPWDFSDFFAIRRLTITYPNGGQTFNPTQSINVTWNHDYVTSNLLIDLYKGGTNQTNWVTSLVSNTPNDGSQTINLPSELSSGTDYLIAISGHEGYVWDFSDSYFTIQNLTPTARIDSYAPNDPNNPIEVQVGNSTPISVTFTNTGNTNWSFIAGASIWDSNGNIVGDYSRTIFLGVGQQTTASWSHTATNSGDYWLQFGIWKDSQTLLDKKPSPSQRLIQGTSTVQVTMQTNPSGLQLVVDGVSYTAPYSFIWTVGSIHVITASSPQSGTTGTQYVYSSWSDGEAQTHTITVSSTNTTYTANLATQYQLTVSSNPTSGGTTNPSGQSWRNSGENVSITATANSGYSFMGWSGDASGSTNPLTLTMNGNKNISASFAINIFTIDLNSSWNLVSWNVDTPNDSVSVVLSDIMANLIIVLGFEKIGLTYDPNWPQFSNLHFVDHLHGYWLNLSAERSFSLIGSYVSPSTSIELETGWNVVSYLPNSTDDIAHALQSIYSNVIVVLGFDHGGLTYDPNWPQFSNLQQMKPGFGYWIKVRNACNLAYPTSKYLAKANQNEHYFSSTVVPSTEWISILGEGISIDGKSILPGSTVKVLDNNGTVCGFGKVSQEGCFGMISVYRDDPRTTIDEGAEPGEEVVVYINDSPLSERIVWKEKGDVIHLTGQKDDTKTTPQDYELIRVFPNPFNSQISIQFSLPNIEKVEITIINTKGELIRRIVNDVLPMGEHSFCWDGSNSRGQTVASGIYMIQIKSNSIHHLQKVVYVR